jgi:beta-N-acetylhexosaminidase
MSPEMLAGRVLVAGFKGTRFPSELSSMALRGELAGAIVFSRNFGPKDQTKEEGFETAAGLLSELATQPTGLPTGRGARGAPLLVCIDEEGGRVRRLGPPLPQLPPARVWGQIDDPSLTERAARAHGEALSAFGVNVDFAPILDVDTNPDNPIIGDRSFGRTSEQVIRHALPFARGLHAGGVLSCGKHFPGHGDTDLDSHLALPRVPHARARLDRVELPPFAAARGVIPMIMTAHVVFPAIDPEVPATLSKKVITDLLRNELGYDGVIVSDDLEMKAVADHYGVEESAVRAIEAGCDLLLVCKEVELLMRAHAALVKRAKADPAFSARLAEAAGRVDGLRAKLPPFSPRSFADLRALLLANEGHAIALELERRRA